MQRQFYTKCGKKMTPLTGTKTKVSNPTDEVL